MVIGFTEKRNGQTKFIPTPQHPALSSHQLMRKPESRFDDKKSQRLLNFARNVKGKTGSSANHINKEIKEKQNAKKQKIFDLNNRVTTITNNPNMSNNEKISSLQRLLNNHDNEMDAALMSRIRLELKELNSEKPDVNDDDNEEATKIPEDDGFSEPEEPEHEGKKLSANELVSLNAINSQVR